MDETKLEKMNYLEWSRVIDEIESVLRGSALTSEINNVFLRTAKAERSKYPKPTEPKNSLVG
jgi:hypothetical protein